jgi:putative sugar O-methyltransferase
MNNFNNKFLEDIINNYKVQKKELSKSKYSMGEHWKFYYDEKNYEKFCNPSNIINFRNNSILSDGFDDSDVRKSKIDFLEFLDKFDNNFLIKNLFKNNIGNSTNCYKFLDYYIDYSQLTHLKYFSEFYKYIENGPDQENLNRKTIKIICEIGGGFGSLARIILNNFNLKYILIDLPEANLVSSYYLRESFPEKKIFLWDGSLTEITLNIINNFDIFILPTNIINNFSKDINIDFFINTYSMMEMKKDSLQKYFDFINSFCSINGYFLNINRYKKDTSGDSICLSEYPYDNNWDCIVSNRSSIRSNMHFLLTQRKLSNHIKNIKSELEYLKPREKNSYNSNEFNKFSNIILIGKIERILKTYIRIFIRNLLPKKIIKNIGKKLYNIDL